VQTPQTQRLYDIFYAGRLQYVVPVYQRAYTWDEENWTSLWEDLQTILERYLDDPSQQPPPQHFLGAVVIELQHFPVGGMEPRFLIDGQQRLTTMQALLAAAATVLDEQGDSDPALELRSLTLNRDKAATGDLRFKIWPAKSDRAAFRSVIDPDVTTPDAETGIIGAYHFFSEGLTEWINRPPADAAEGDPEGAAPTKELVSQRAAALHTCLRDLVYVVTINLDENDNAQVIFETLNARGTPLSALDLAKNALFLQAERESTDVEALHDQHWRPVFEADGFWQEEETQGRERRPRGEWFLFHWLAMELEKVVGTSDLFSTFRREKLRPADHLPMDELVPALCRDAQLYRAFGDQPQRTPERLFFDRLRTMDTTTVFPLALLLFRSPQVSVEVRRKALGAVESWLVRRSLLRYQSRAYNRLMPRLLTASKQDLARADVQVVSELRGWSANSDVWPKDQELRERLLFGRLYDYIGQSRIRMALEACERSLRDSPKTEPIDLPEGLSIEHVIPQAWQEHWPPPAAADPDEAIALREAHIHRLGNLTLVTTPLNSSMQHSPWTRTTAVAPEKAEYEKREELMKHSVLLLNQRLGLLEVWDESSIAERGDDLVTRIIETWPGSDSAYWNPTS
jgi:hypothetical protein